MAKVQDKHEVHLNELINDNRRQMEKLAFYDEKMKEFTAQIHALNEEKLMLLKEHEIMKSKLRTYEIDSTLSRGNGTSTSAMFFDKIRGKLQSRRKNDKKLFNLLKFYENYLTLHSDILQVETSEWKMKRVNFSITPIWMS